MAKLLPVIGEIYTSVESAVCAGAAGWAKVFGDDKAASQFWGAARNAWVDYSKENLRQSHQLDFG